MAAERTFVNHNQSNYHRITHVTTACQYPILSYFLLLIIALVANGLTLRLLYKLYCLHVQDNAVIQGTSWYPYNGKGKGCHPIIIGATLMRSRGTDRRQLPESGDKLEVGNIVSQSIPSLPLCEYHQAHQPLKSSVGWCHSVWALIYNIFNIPPGGRAGQLVLLIALSGRC